MTILDEAIQFTLGKEGGWYAGNEARDPNPTMYGVTQATYAAYRSRKGRPPRSVRLIDLGEVREIYEGYWGPAGCDLVGRLTAITLFDHSINAGPAAARKVLQRAAGVIDDGVLGAASRAAIGAVPDAELATRVCFERIRFYTDVAKKPSLRPNLLSWVHRVITFRETYLK